MTTEIYSCKEGQELKQGKLDYSSDITTREQAEADAKRRCQRDPSLKKVAYYKVAPDGEFRVFFSYTNPNCRPEKPRPARHSSSTGGGAKAKPPAQKAPAARPGLLARLMRSLGLGG